MISQEVVAATPREGKFNKNAARRVRVKGKIPAVVYGAAEPAVAIEVDPKQIQKILHSDSGHNSIFDLEITGSTAKTKAMIVDWQYEPIKGTLMHIDLKRIALDKAMTRRGSDSAHRYGGRREGPGRHSRPGAARSGD